MPSPYPPIDPGPSAFDLDSVVDQPGDDLVAVGADLAPATLVAAYRRGIFPMGIGEGGTAPLAWWRPDTRGVLLPGGLHVSRSLRASLRRYRVSVDRAFDAVVAGCADPARPGSWITREIAAAYAELHRLGWAHSVEVWAGEPGEGELVGGLYGVSVGSLFAGESMFHRARDASKVALVALDALVLTPSRPNAVIDVQWQTAHLASLGVTEVSRPTYSRLVAGAVDDPPVDWRRAVADQATQPPWR